MGLKPGFFCHFNALCEVEDGWVLIHGKGVGSFICYKHAIARLMILYRGTCYRDGSAQHRSVEIGFDLQESAKLLEPLTNASQADADVACFPKTIENLSGDAHAIVLDRENDLGGTLAYANVNRPASGMAMNIGEGLLKNAKQRSLRAAGEPS